MTTEEVRAVAIVIAVVCAGLLGALALQAWLLLHLRDQQTRLHRRIDDLARRAASAGWASPAAQRAPAAAAPAAQPAPPFALPSLAGPTVSLEALLAPRMPLVLTFVDPRCGPCYELLPDIGGWQRAYGDRLGFALVSGSPPEHNRAMTAEYGIAAVTVLLQAEREVGESYGVTMAPAAVPVQPDGCMTAGPVYGTAAVRQLVADALGLAVPAAPGPAAEAAPAVGLGQPVPALRRPDLDGNSVDLGALGGEPTLLLFWSPGCGHCRDLLPDIRAWEERPDGPRLLVVTSGPVGLTRGLGLRSRMVPDDDHSLKRAFGVQATPSAVVVDALGPVASEVARGANGVRALVAQRFAPAAALAG
jgi:thiol-disulfide isomerase/thioredoxin